jgi:Glycosyltransferase family 87
MRMRSEVARILAVGSNSNRLLRTGLGAIAVTVIAASLVNHLLLVYPFSVDLEIPLRAAQRWVDGGQPYLASAFTAPPGATQPFLYPPFILPVAAVLLQVPKLALQLIWLALCLGSAVFAVRRLAFPLAWWPFVLAWSPFAEGIIGGNVQIPAFACFVALFWRRSGQPDRFRPTERNVAEVDESAVRLGLLSATIGALKVSQLQPWLFLARHRPAAAAVGAAAVIGIVALSLPLTGANLWLDWLAQLGRATDPAWELSGIALSRFTPPGVGLIVMLLATLAVVVIPNRTGAAAWIGLLSVWGTPSLHPFGLLFLLPAMLVIRREIALVAAMLIGTTTYEGSWAGIILVTVAYVGTVRFRGLAEPAPRDLSRESPVLGATADA